MTYKIPIEPGFFQLCYIRNLNSLHSGITNYFHLNCIPLYITIGSGNKKITFSKIDLQRKLHSKEDLTIVNDRLINGVDSLGYKLEYKKSEI